MKVEVNIMNTRCIRMSEAGSHRDTEEDEINVPIALSAFRDNTVTRLMIMTSIVSE